MFWKANDVTFPTCRQRLSDSDAAPTAARRSAACPQPRTNPAEDACRRSYPRTRVCRTPRRHGTGHLTVRTSCHPSAVTPRARRLSGRRPSHRPHSARMEAPAESRQGLGCNQCPSDQPRVTVDGAQRRIAWKMPAQQNQTSRPQRVLPLRILPASWKASIDAF